MRQSVITTTPPTAALRRRSGVAFISVSIGMVAVVAVVSVVSKMVSVRKFSFFMVGAVR
jgi:hypothetical protein